MNALECKAYLERIGYQEEPHTDKDCLEKLMELQLQSVPFENLEVFKEKRVPSLKTEDIFHKIVHQERGGCCFELNKIFYELLKGLGFDVTPLAIRMLWSPDDFRRILHRATMVPITATWATAVPVPGIRSSWKTAFIPRKTAPSA